MSQNKLFQIVNIFLVILLNQHMSASNAITLHVIHFNDFHGRLLPTNSKGEDCRLEDIETQQCFGGLAKLKHKIDEIFASFQNVILFNVGDLAQGTLFYTVFGWEVFLHFFNMLNQTAMAFGAHEFDYGPEELLSLILKLNCPVLCCNIDDEKMPNFQKSYNKSTVIIVNGQKVGLIGYIAQSTASATKSGFLEFDDEIEAIKAESNKLNSENVSIIIALGQSGFSVDQTIAGLPFIDVVVGGKSHTFLYTGTPPSTDKPQGNYPTVIRKTDGSVGLVVQAGSFGKYLGFLGVTFNAQGHITSWNGNPILMDNTVKEDRDVAHELSIWNTKLEETVNEKVGETNVFMDGRETVCRQRECNLGNILADAFVFLGLKYVKSRTGWNHVAIALTNGGGIRDSINERVITRHTVYQTLPYKNQIYFVEMMGETLKNILEFSAFQLRNSSEFGLDGRFIQVSGLKVTYDICQAPGNRVNEVKALCNECRVPKYFPLDKNAFYRVAMTDFIMVATIAGGVTQDNDYSGQQATGVADSDALMEYFKARGSMITGTERRIVIIEEDGCKKNLKGSTVSNKPTFYIIIILNIYYFLWLYLLFNTSFLIQSS